MAKKSMLSRFHSRIGISVLGFLVLAVLYAGYRRFAPAGDSQTKSAQAGARQSDQQAEDSPPEAETQKAPVVLPALSRYESAEGDPSPPAESVATYNESQVSAVPNYSPNILATAEQPEENAPESTLASTSEGPPAGSPPPEMSSGDRYASLSGATPSGTPRGNPFGPTDTTEETTSDTTNESSMGESGGDEPQEMQPMTPPPLPQGPLSSQPKTNPFANAVGEGQLESPTSLQPEAAPPALGSFPERDITPLQQADQALPIEASEGAGAQKVGSPLRKQLPGDNSSESTYTADSAPVGGEQLSASPYGGRYGKNMQQPEQPQPNGVLAAQSRNNSLGSPGEPLPASPPPTSQIEAPRPLVNSTTAPVDASNELPATSNWPQRHANSLPSRSSAEQTSSPAAYADSAPRSLPASGGQVYTVQGGESLLDIAGQELGSSRNWAALYMLNRDNLGGQITNLPTGTPIVIPESP